MNIKDLLITIENLKGSYKKFSSGYPISGVTFPTHYGYIQGYSSEDGKDLDVFLGNGELCGYIKMFRPTCPNGIETKTFIHLSQKELEDVVVAYGEVVREKKLLKEQAFLDYIQKFKGNTHVHKKGDLIYTNLLSPNSEALIDFYKTVVGLPPLEPNADPSLETWYGFKTGNTQFAIEPLSNRDKYSFEYNVHNPVLIQFMAESIEHLNAWTEQLENNNVTIGQRVLKKSYGTVTTFVDPDGNVIELLFR